MTGYLREHVKKHDLGRVMSNDTFVQVSPDTVFGADVYFISYQRLPKGKIPDEWMDLVPELVVEVRSPRMRGRNSAPKCMNISTPGYRS
jgi:Uma2 family endonuclease